eukprot:4540594-Karenia_brevis.AAC.1
MVEIILSAPRNKRPGPDGIPAAVYRDNAASFADPFLEAFDDLQDDDYLVPDSLGQRLWKVAPKVAGADKLSMIRDLEMPNECRKVLARAYSRILDEQASRTMKAYQQAFLKQRDI